MACVMRRSWLAELRAFVLPVGRVEGRNKLENTHSELLSIVTKRVLIIKILFMELFSELIQSILYYYEYAIRSHFICDSFFISNFIPELYYRIWKL